MWPETYHQPPLLSIRLRYRHSRPVRAGPSKRATLAIKHEALRCCGQKDPFPIGRRPMRELRPGP